MANNRQVGTLWCFDILAMLSDFLDGDVTQAEREQIEVHLQGCEECMRFGGEFGSVIRALRKSPEAPLTLSADIEERLKRKLDRI